MPALSVFVEGIGMVSVILRPTPRAKRMTLRMNKRGGHFILTYPARLQKTAVENYLYKNIKWMQSVFFPSAPIEHGALFPIWGEDYQIDGHAARFFVDNDLRIIACKPQNIARQIQAYLKAEAAIYAPAIVDYYAGQIGKSVSGIKWSEATSYWGLCSQHAIITLNWRLAMMPKSAMNYVIAHEVAHLKVFNHSKTFWKLVEELYPDYQAAKALIKSTSQRVNAYDFSPKNSAD